MSVRKVSPVVRGLQYSALFLYVAFLGFPLLWLASLSFKPPPEMVTLHPALLPKHWDFSNFGKALSRQNLLQAATNSTKVAAISTLVVIVVALPAAYGLARFGKRLRTAANGWILVSQVFPLVLIVIPLFLVLKSASMINTHRGLVIIYLVWSLPFALWMLQSYITGIPVDLEEASAVDGAGRLRILVSVVLPLLAPGVVATAMFTFISAWNEFFFALVIIQDPDKVTLPLALARFVGAEGQVQLGPLAAGSLLATLPSLAFFAFLQRRLTSGLLNGAVKG